ncbi:PA14 domain-containing protein [Robinsoniella peoriensis]
MKRKNGFARGVSLMLSVALVLNTIVMPVSASGYNEAAVSAGGQVLETEYEQSENRGTKTEINQPEGAEMENKSDIGIESNPVIDLDSGIATDTDTCINSVTEAEIDSDKFAETETETDTESNGGQGTTTKKEMDVDALTVTGNESGLGQEPENVTEENNVKALADMETGLFGEIFNTEGYRGGSIELFNFENKTGEQIFPSLSGQNLRPVFDKYNGNKGDEQFATARFTGKINVEKAGDYKFFGWGDDGFRIWIDGKMVIDFWVQEWEKEQTSKEVALSEGLHDIKIEYLQGWGGAVLKLSWESINANIAKEVIPEKVFYHVKTPADAGLTAQFYKVNGKPSSITSFGFAGEPVNQVLPNLDGREGLKEAIELSNGSSEYASAIIHGYITPQESGDYEFVMNGDDAFRFWINDELKINSWKLHSDQTKISEPVHMEKGFLYKIRINYAQADGDANLNLSWKKEGGQAQVVPAECFRQAAKAIQGETAAEDQHGLLAEVYGDIFLEEKKGEVIAPVLDKSLSIKKILSQYNGSEEYGSFRFSGQVDAEETGDYTFYLIGDDGFRLWVNDELAIDFWESKWDKQQVSQPIHLNEGRNDIRIEYFQGYGGAYIMLEWMKPGAEEKEVIPTENLYPANTKKGLIGEIYQENGGGQIKLAEVLANEVSSEQFSLNSLVSYYEGNENAPANVELNGKIKPHVSGTYELAFGASGNYQVYLNDEKIISQNAGNVYKEAQSRKVELKKGIYYNLTVIAENLNLKEDMNLSWTLDGVRSVIGEDQLYAPEAMWYENVTAREKLYVGLTEAAALRKNTEAGTGEGQIAKEHMDKFAAVIDEIAADAKDFDIIASVLKVDTNKITDAVAEFKLNIIRTQKGEELTQFNNALYQGQDPFISYHDGYYYFVSSSNDPSHNKMYVSKSKSLLDQGEKVRIFDFNDSKSRIFAPEMFFIDGKWYIYYCADAKEYNWRHMACVMESVTDDPQGDWIDRGVLYTGMEIKNPNEFAQGNDFTVFQYQGQLYACWGSMESGVESPAIARMESPTKITEERSFLPGFGGEGPRAIVNGDHLFMTVSQGSFKTAGYHMGMYIFDTSKNDILNPDNWSYQEGVFEGTKDVYGPARASFFKSADGTEDWMAFHSKVYPANNNAWRQVSIKKFTWNEDGSPNFGRPVSPYEFTALPSGDPGLGLAYQAEDGDLSGGAKKEYKGKGFQGTGYGNITDTLGEKITFKVNVPADGDYFVRARYANGVKAPISTTDNRGEWEANIPDITPKAGTLNLYVNDAGLKSVTVPFDKTETDWQHWMTVCSRVTLKKGENTISYVKDAENSGNVYLDYITVQEAHEHPAAQTVKTGAELDALIAEVEGYQEEEYSIETWRIFSGALLSAKSVNKDAVQAVSNRYLSLEAAAKDLSNYVLIHADNNVRVSGDVKDDMFRIGSEVTVQAKDLAGKTFSRWEVSGFELTEEQKVSNEFTFTVPRNRGSMVPVYAENEYYKVTAGTNVRIDNAAANSLYQAGTTVKATVGIPQGNQFIGWDVKGITLTEAEKMAVTISFVMPESEVVLNAAFENIVIPEKPKYQLKTGAGISIANAAKDQLYTAGTRIQATVSVPAGKVFVQWKAAGVTLTAQQQKSTVISFLMPASSVSLEAVFDIQKKKQTITAKDFKKTDGDKSFYIKAKASGKGKLSYKSDHTKVVKVDSKGKVTIKGTGKAQITITAAGNSKYDAAVKKIIISVAPKKTTDVKAVSKKSKTLKLSWKKTNGASGYVISYSTDKKFKKGVRKVVISSGKTTSRTLKKLRANKICYVKIRAFKTSGKSRVYGKYSKTVSVWVKK